MSSPIQPPPQTPSAATTIKPPMSEMHPSKAHLGTMAAPSSALRLGFTDIRPKDTSAPALGAHQSTPSKSKVPPPSPFRFQNSRDPVTAADSNLGPEAQRIMNELREEAAKIRAELAAKREEERHEDEQVNTRKIAQPKGKAGRYSQVHMAEFKKMDSIANHPSAFRAMPGRFTPTAASSSSKGIKRTQSKANLDDTETPQTRIPAKTSSSKSRRKVETPGKNEDHSPAKRTKQDADDDASTNRPISREGSNIPRPKTPGKDSRGIPRAKTFAHMMSPTQSSLARAASTKPTAPRSLLRTPSKVSLTGIKKSATATNLDAMDCANVDMEDAPAKMRSTSLSAKVRSIFAKHKPAAPSSKPGILKRPGGDTQTPAPARAHTEVPPAPLTTPGKRFAQRGDFTPAPKHAALAQNSPSPVKTGIPRSKTGNNLVNYPSLDTVMEGAAGDAVSYPDLSGVGPLSELPTPTENVALVSESSSEKAMQAPVSVPGTFTFRSDHTINFRSDSPQGFGANYGQASVRHVRPSIVQSMPGAFPVTNSPKTTGPRGKENLPPFMQQSFDPKAFAHGVSSKKRYRVEDDEKEAEREAEERAAKKMRNAAVPEGEALMAPRLSGVHRSSPFRSPSKIMKKSPIKSRIPAAPATPGSVQKTTGISMSRLAYLAQPRQRK